MKKIIIVLAVVIAAGAIAGCKKKKGNDEAPVKSAACDIVTFTVGSDEWQIEGTNITYQYPKGTTKGTLTPTITVSAGAKLSPKTGVAQDFFTTAISYTVTAEDGKTTKSYTAEAKVATTK
jgi:hypothetical protein